MSNNNQKMAISKSFLICLLFICIMFTSFSINSDVVFATNSNNVSVDEIGLELDVEDKLKNSQDSDGLSVSDNDGVLGKTYTLSSTTFSKLRETINNASSGDTIVLSGTITQDSASSGLIDVKKKLTITSNSQATLNAKGLSGIFYFYSGATGSSLSNLKFINGNSDYGGALRIGAKNMVIDNCVFENNKDTQSGGAVYTRNNAFDSEGLIVRNCNFTKNTARIGGGALVAWGNNSRIINCIFDSNGVVNNESCYGGAIQVGLHEVDSYCSVISCTFKNNYAKCTSTSSNYGSHGGAGCIRTGSSYTNCVFINNSADHGGALTFHGSGILENSQFEQNTATKFGGAVSVDLIYNDYMNLEIKDSTFSYNSAPLGGAIRLGGMNIGIKNCNFQNNHASQNGGAINIYAKTVSVSDSVFLSNTADNDGGALFLIGSNTTVKNSEFYFNNVLPSESMKEKGLGGAIYVNSTNALIEDNNFLQNVARNGSAVYYDQSGEQLILRGNTLQSNQAWVYELPIYVNDIYYGEKEEIKVVFHGGNNIARYDDLSVSNAIYNAAGYDKIMIDGENPVSGATNNGAIYQDDREYNVLLRLTVSNVDGPSVYEGYLYTSYLGEISNVLSNLEPGTYNVTAEHYEDTYYKGISNTSYFVVKPKVDNGVKKATTNDTFDYEDRVVWTLNITNNGPNKATDVIVVDVLPEGLIYFEDDSGGKYDPETGILKIDSLEVGEVFTINIVTIVDKTGSIINEANVSSNEYDIDLSNNRDDASIVVNPASDMSITKSTNNSFPEFGQLVDWTITVKNNGPDIAHDVFVMDMLPNSLIYINSSDDRYDVTTGIWNIGTLNVGGESILHIITQVNSTGLIENNVSVSSHEFDYDLSNNVDNEIIMVGRASDLSIVKSVNSTTANFNDLVKWTLTITNSGPDDSTDVVIVDVLPEGFIYVDSRLDKGNYIDGKIYVSNLSVGEILKFDIITLVNITGNFTNTANITGSGYDINLTNNEDLQDIFIYPASDLEVLKEVDESMPDYLDVVVWTITVKNNGPDIAHNVSLIDLLPESLVWVGDNSNNMYNPEIGIWNVGELDVGDYRILQITCIVNATGSINNNVSVNSSEYDYNLENNIASENISIESSADVSITKLVNNTNPNYQDLIKWTLIVSNSGPDKATDVVVEEILPNGLILIDFNLTKGIFDDGTWVVCCLEKDEIESLELVCRINKTGEFTNVATISAEEYDPDLTNNKANKTINVPLACDIEINNEVNTTNVLFGDVVMWNISIRNNGPDNATGVSIVDILPESLIQTNYTTSVGEYNDGIWSVGSLNVGELQYLIIYSSVNELDDIVNIASANSTEYDWNMSNNIDNAMINVKPVADLSIIKIVNNTNPNYGDYIKWTLLVNNFGPNNATGVFVFDSLPSGVTFVSSYGGQLNGDVWDVGDLYYGETKEIEIICKITSTGNFTNYATIGGNEFDLNLTNNKDSQNIYVRPASDLSITKSVSKYEYHVGDLISYTIKLVNNGPDVAENVKVNEILDDSLTLKSVKVSKGNFNKLNQVWSIPTIGVGESVMMQIKAVAAESGLFKNIVSVVSDNYDFDLENNEDSAVVNVTPTFKDNITKFLPKPLVKVNTIAHTVLENNISGNPILVVLLSAIFSVLFFTNTRLKKR